MKFLVDVHFVMRFIISFAYLFGGSTDGDLRFFTIDSGSIIFIESVSDRLPHYIDKFHAKYLQYICSFDLS